MNFHMGMTFKCDFCQKNFKTKDYLRGHLKMHKMGGKLFEPRNNDERRLNIEKIRNNQNDANLMQEKNIIKLG